FFFSSRSRHTRFSRDWSSDVCSSDLLEAPGDQGAVRPGAGQADIQVVASRFGREAAGSGGARGTIRGDPVAMLRGFALETAVPGGVIPLVMPAAVNQKPHVVFPRLQCGGV